MPSPPPLPLERWPWSMSPRNPPFLRLLRTLKFTVEFYNIIAITWNLVNVLAGWASSDPPVPNQWCRIHAMWRDHVQTRVHGTQVGELAGTEWSSNSLAPWIWTFVTATAPAWLHPTEASSTWTVSWSTMKARRTKRQRWRYWWEWWSLFQSWRHAYSPCMAFLVDPFVVVVRQGCVV